MSRKIYVAGSSTYANWMQGTLVNSIDEADLICMTGGEDISVKVAREEVTHPTLYCNEDRDRRELKIWNRCFELNKKIIAICRSSQMASILGGGRLVRDQDNPKGEHEIITHDGQIILSASTHHNAMWPWNIDKDKWKLLGWTINNSTYHEDQYSNECVNGVVKDNKECEIVLFKNINTLAHQHHFEFCDWKHDERYAFTLNYLRKQLDDFMNDAI